MPDERLDYTPSLSHGLPNPYASATLPPPSGTLEPTLAPTTSGLYSFQYFDAREHGLIRKFGPQKGASQLLIVFRDKHSGGPGKQYQYYFPNAARGAELFAELCDSPHPFEDVFLAKIRNDPGIKYTLLSG